MLLSKLGAVAQWSEQSAHNRLVAGSSPASPTITIMLALIFYILQN